MPIVLPTTSAVHDQKPKARDSDTALSAMPGADQPGASASVSAVSNSTMASSTCARVIINGGMNRTVLTPQESNNNPLWKARVST